MNCVLRNCFDEEFNYIEEDSQEEVINEKVIEELETAEKKYTKEQISHMVIQYQSGNKQMFDKIYEHYTPILKRWAIRKSNYDMAYDLLDTVLLNAANNYDISKRTQFDTFFWTCANNFIMNEHNTEDAYKRKSNKNNMSLNKIVGNSDSTGIEFGMLLTDKKFERDFKHKELEISIKQMKEQLKDTEYKIISDILDGFSIADISERLNITTSGVCMSLKRLGKKGLIADEIFNIIS